MRQQIFYVNNIAATIKFQEIYNAF